MARRGLIASMLAALSVTIFYSADGNAQNSLSIPGVAKDVAVGGGKVWVIGANPLPPSGYGIYRWNEDRRDWDKMPGAGERIAVDSNGNAWVVNAQRNVYAFNGNTFEGVRGGAYDIGAGGGKVWVIGTNFAPPFGYGIYRWNEDRRDWDTMPGAAERIAVDSKGNAWVINAQHNIYTFNGNTFYQVPGPPLTTSGLMISPGSLGDRITRPMAKISTDGMALPGSL